MLTTNNLLPMKDASVTLQIPDPLYQRLVNTAQAVGRSLEDIMVHALTVGSPPDWTDAPEEFQTDLARLDRLDNDTLWQIAQSHQSSANMERYNQLLEKNQEEELTQNEYFELEKLRYEADLFMLKKAQATVLLRWRGERFSINS
ncbi:hypothetical protein VB715_19450 [Crocosphaera sp. UHCC 0190]|uniref:hypothetical protein n=1 Tax=unclassified Crocosphaera TaxID=2623705 RepID=UPI002B218EDF|nr:MULTISPECIES: hypothetical protein [unclassified Crocosphaera]MEA5511952.1 hypothetical protein [Crocosphaera sp. UHCC 0190]MEA5536680.1 hypothetical protein [Crocosphaera sp. XPORK-15E]